MSNSYILVQQKRTHWEVSERDVGGDDIIRSITRRKSLEEAITLATLWLEESIDGGDYIDYGIRFKFLNKTE
jgi:hypothetical protein